MQRNRNVHYGNSCYDCKKSLFIQTPTTTPAARRGGCLGYDSNVQRAIIACL